MIRFVDLRGMETGRNFAFWDTVSDQFLNFDGEQAWDNKKDFASDFQMFVLAGGDISPRASATGFLQRLLGLIPDDIPRTREDSYAEKEEPKLCVDCDCHVATYMTHLCQKVTGVPEVVTRKSPMVYRECLVERSPEGSCGPEAKNFEPKE